VLRNLRRAISADLIIKYKKEIKKGFKYYFSFMHTYIYLYLHNPNTYWCIKIYFYSFINLLNGNIIILII